MSDGEDKVYETMKNVTAAVVLNEMVSEFPEETAAVLGMRRKRPLPHLSEACMRAAEGKEQKEDEGVQFVW